VTGRFAGKVALVTGAANGLGRAHALLLAAEGARVVVNDYGGDAGGRGAASEPAAEVVAQIIDAGGDAVADTHDVATDGAAVVQTAIEAFGALHCVVNNAGIVNGGTVEELSAEDFDRLLDVHVGGTVAVTRAAWPIFRAQGYGRIVNTTSCSVFGLPHSPAYITAKSAILGFTRAIARDGEPYDIRANAVMPTAHTRLTAQHPDFAALMSAAFPPEAVSPFVLRLLLNDVPCNGETFVVGGGRAARVLLATVPGAVGLSSIEACIQRFDQVLDSQRPFIPADATQEILYECEHLGINIADLFAPKRS
jgi:NAD(P)-dependent dehydrogenase (short-subunit alcohol dehydrogenase family)